MSNVLLEITMSVDGFTAGVGVSEEQPMGKNGLRLHDWIFNAKTAADTALLQDLVNNTGAVILGHYTYASAINTAWEKSSPFTAPAFVLCSAAPKTNIAGFTFITDGIRSALEKAKAVAANKNIWIMGGANTAQQFLQENLVDEIHLHITPVLLGRGIRLFDQTRHLELKILSTVETPGAVHIRFRVVR